MDDKTKQPQDEDFAIEELSSDDLEEVSGGTCDTCNSCGGACSQCQGGGGDLSQT